MKNITTLSVPCKKEILRFQLSNAICDSPSDQRGKIKSINFKRKLELREKRVAFCDELERKMILKTWNFQRSQSLKSGKHVSVNNVRGNYV